MQRLGEGDIALGFERLNAMPFAEARREVEHPVACIDCHDPETLALRITRPAFIAGMRAWVHAETGAPLLEAQHPEFELWSQGTHARTGVACADCHMPYRREGAKKISDHQVRSPLLDVSRACQTCHAVAESELLARVEQIQQRTFEQRERALGALVDFVEAENSLGFHAPGERR